MPGVRLIDANAAADKIMRETENHADDLGVIGIAMMIHFAKVLRDENDFPTIEAEPVRHGRWDEIQCFSEHGIPMASYECTNCGNDIERQRGVVPAFCEFCGAKKDDLLQRLGKCEDALYRIESAIKDALFTLDQQIQKERLKNGQA